ncbi:MAG: BON domain-containing protein [Xanthobacteraceae bacterium]|nr:BON domain-containing protein [Xanthobacteraceae bacterium]
MNELSLRDDVLDELGYEPTVDAAHIGVAVDRNVVTLSGHVATYAERLAAVAAVRRVSGVHAIADDIQVAGAADETLTDAEIARRAVEVLGWDSVVPDDAVQVTVRDGRVTLSGEVHWHYQRTSAEDDVRKLAGVRSISNEIKLTPRADAGEVKRSIEQALRRHAEIEAGRIRISIIGAGEVALEGEVSDWSEKAAAETAAWSAPGVTAVRDRLVIAPSDFSSGSG